MTVAFSPEKLGEQVAARFPEAIGEATEKALALKSESLVKVAEYLRDTPDLSFDYLNYITAVDYYDYFEIVYQVTSLTHNHTAVFKTRCYDRERPSVPSVVSVWTGADLQEREVYDLMGITFEGHPNMKRIMLWEGFQGHPLRKDYL